MKFHGRTRSSKLVIVSLPRVPSSRNRACPRERSVSSRASFYPAIISIDLPGTNCSLSPRTVRFLIMLCDTCEKSFRRTRIRSSNYSEMYFLLEGTVSFLILIFPSSSFLENTSPPGPTTREMTSIRENEAFLHCVYNVNDEF